MTNNIKQERRYRRTEALILNGLTTLLQQKSIKEITVRELADLVDINRSTFYLHYTDIYDLLEKTEQRLLRLLVENRGRTLPRELLLEKVWDGGEFVDENALSVAVRRLRGKLGNAPIRTVYGVGYTWEVSK